MKTNEAAVVEMSGGRQSTSNENQVSSGRSFKHDDWFDGLSWAVYRCGTFESSLPYDIDNKSVTVLGVHLSHSKVSSFSNQW